MFHYGFKSLSKFFEASPKKLYFVVVATADLDYESSSVELGFPSGSADGDMICASIRIVDDRNEMEDDEIFTVSLTTSDSIILLESTTAITIRNGERVVC